MTEHNQSKYYLEPYPTQNMSEYNNPYKFNGKEMDRETGMYYYGARYYDPRISIFISVDPLAEEFPNYGGYVYTMNNPINLVDPTGMAPEDTDPPGGKKTKNDRGDKVFNIKVYGRDKSIYENDKGLIAGLYRLNKSIRKASDKLLSGGFHFYVDDSGAQGDLSLQRKSKKPKSVENVNVTGVMRLASYTTAYKRGIKVKETPRRTAESVQNMFEGVDKGISIREDKNVEKLREYFKVTFYRGPRDSMPTFLTPEQNRRLHDYKTEDGEKFRDSIRSGFDFNAYKYKKDGQNE